MQKLESDPEKSVEELLRAISDGAEAGLSDSIRNPNRALPPFAALLVKLSRTAEATASKVVKLTWGLLLLTLALLILTGVLVWQERSHEETGSPQQQQHSKQ